jgi:hypothetical protein
LLKAASRSLASQIRTEIEVDCERNPPQKQSEIRRISARFFESAALLGLAEICQLSQCQPPNRRRSDDLNRLRTSGQSDFAGADYVVILENGRGTQDEPGTVRQNSPNVGTLLFIPVW